MVERKQRKTYACELYRERGSGLNGPSMMNNVKWENKWRNTGKGAQHPTTLEMSNFRPLHARCSPEPMFGHQANSSSFNSTAGSSRPRSVTWEDEPGMPATLSECGSRGLGKPQMSTTQQFYQGRPVRSVSPPPRPTHSTQKQLSHTSYIFGNVEVVNPVGRPSSTLDPLHHTGWVQPNANLTNSGPWPSDFNGRPSSVAEGATRGQAGRSPSPTERAPSCPPVISSCGQFENGEASAAPGWRSSQRLSEVFSADGTGLSSDPDNMLVAAAEVENFPGTVLLSSRPPLASSQAANDTSRRCAVGARHRLHAGPQRTAIYGRSALLSCAAASLPCCCRPKLMTANRGACSLSTSISIFHVFVHVHIHGNALTNRASGPNSAADLWSF